MPTRKTGIVRRMLGFEIRVRRRDIAEGFAGAGESESSKRIGDWGASEGGFELLGSGMTARRIKHNITEPIARLQGIHGEISVVTDATNEAISSAT
jgi:hypothetical protein